MAEPKIRFKKENGENYTKWGESVLGDFLEIRDEKQVPTEEAPLMAFIAYQGVVPKGDRYDRSFLVKSDDKKYKRTEYGDFIYSSNNLDVGSIGLNKYGTAVISVVYEIFKSKKTVLPDVINNIIQMPRNMANIIQFRQGCLYGQYKIHPEDFLSIEVSVPSLAEQQKIASFFSDLDEVITQSEAEVVALEKQKKGVMQKIFSQEIRFKKDDGGEYPEWEEKKLNDVCEFSKEHKTGNNYIGTENMFQNYAGADIVGNRTGSGTAYKIGDTLMSNIRPYLKKVWTADRNGVCSTDVLVFRPTDVLSSFLHWMIASDEFVTYVMNTAKGTKMPRGDKGYMMQKDILLPCLEEQQKIADFLSSFDEAIDLAKQELEKWKLLKKGLLQQMFV